MIKGIDCAAPLTTEKAQAFKKLGYEFVGRYFCPTGNWKRLYKAEADAIIGAGLKILAVYETTTDRAKGGAAAGAKDGARAYAQAKELDMPSSGIIYFAVDYEALDADFDTIEAYLRAARQQTGEYEIGVYGSYRVIEAMHRRGACKGFWQCVAWSYGKISEHHTVYQHQWQTTIAGHDVDLNTCPDMSAAGIWNYEEEIVMDNTPSSWAKEAVEWAAKTGLMKGDDRGNLKLHEPVTREQLMVFLHRFRDLA